MEGSSQKEIAETPETRAALDRSLQTIDLAILDLAKALRSVSGSIELLLPADVSTHFEAFTMSGSIRNELGPEARRTSRYGPGMELSFSTGDGDARISARSFSGSVVFRTW